MIQRPITTKPAPELFISTGGLYWHRAMVSEPYVLTLVKQRLNARDFLGIDVCTFSNVLMRADDMSPAQPQPCPNCRRVMLAERAGRITCHQCGRDRTEEVQLIVREGSPRGGQAESRTRGRALTSREVATVLAALRFWQASTDKTFRSGCSHFEDETPMNDEEIDDLCEEINCGVIA